MLTDILDEEGDSIDPDFITRIRDFILENKAISIVVSLGFLFVILGLIIFVDGSSQKNDFEIIGETTESQRGVFVVEVSGAVVSPGVYEIEEGKRIEEAIEVAGGLTESADTIWISKVLNRAAKVTDGQKIYIPSVQDGNNTYRKTVESANEIQEYQSVSSAENTKTEGYTNINTASASELEKMWGIGRITAEKIIEQRPYSSVEELLKRKILKENVYERNKNRMTVY